MATKIPSKPSKQSKPRKPTKPRKPRKPSKPKVESKDKVIQHFDDIKKDILELRTRIGVSRRSDFTKLSEDVAKKVGDSASEIMKHSADVLHKATKVLQFAALGAVEGGKKALKEEKKPRRRATGTTRKTSKKPKA